MGGEHLLWLSEGVERAELSKLGVQAVEGQVQEAFQVFEEA